MQSPTWIPIPPCIFSTSITRQSRCRPAISTIRAISVNPSQTPPPVPVQKETDDDVVPDVKQIETPLLDTLIDQRDRIQANFFCPGHKQGATVQDRMRDALGPAALRSDLPELPALDNLFAPEGAIAEAQALAADAFTSTGRSHWASFFSVNGTTSGIEAAFLACTKPGTCVILPRNVHQSAVHALVLSGAVPYWIRPVYDSKHDIAHGITPDAVREALDFMRGNDMKVSAVLLVSPTYHGALTDVHAISNVIHEHVAKNVDKDERVVLIVDEAHGAHFAFGGASGTSAHGNQCDSRLLPQSASECGADIVLQSVHKTLPALTQAAIMHANRHSVDEGRIRAALQLVQSSSPNYLLLASIDSARALMSSTGNVLLKQTVALADNCAQRVNELSGFSVLGRSNSETVAEVFAFDPTRLTILLPCWLSGYDLDDQLIDQYGVYVELPSFRHLTLVFTVGSSQNDVDHFVNALSSLVKRTPVDDSECRNPIFPAAGLNVDIYNHNESTPMTPRDAFFSSATEVQVNDAVGRISADTLCPYPPGIPVVLPGEVITDDALHFLKAILKAGGSVSGAGDNGLSTVRVIDG